MVNLMQFACAFMLRAGLAGIARVIIRAIFRAIFRAIVRVTFRVRQCRSELLSQRLARQ